MPDPQATSLNARLYNLIKTGIDSDTGLPPGGTPTQQNPGGTGVEYVHSLYPNEIECYAAALELVDGNGYTEEFFSFPVMFRNYSETRPTNASIEKTMAGVVITNNPTFIPFDIHFSGNFGRKFKLINTVLPANQSVTNNNNGATAGSGQSITVTRQPFSSDYKTGYGCYKIMEKIILKAQKQDANFQSYQLFFYNLSLNSNYLVEPIMLSPSQERESSNMIWNYNLHLKAVAPASGTNKNYSSSLKLLTNYTHLTSETAAQSDVIQQNQDDRLQIDKQQSKVQLIIQLQAQGRAYGINNSQQRSTLQALIQLTDDPTDLGDFSAPPTQGIIGGIL